MLSLRYLVQARAADMRAANSDRVAAVALDGLPADPATLSESRNATRSAVSCGVPNRPVGCCASSAVRMSASIHPVSTGPGFTTLEVMPRWASSRAEVETAVICAPGGERDVPPPASELDGDTSAGADLVADSGDEGDSLHVTSCADRSPQLAVVTSAYVAALETTATPHRASRGERVATARRALPRENPL